MRFVIGKVAALAVASALAATAVVGCSSTPQNQQAENLGAVGMHLKVGPGITLDAVTLTITDTAHPDPVMVRTIPAPGDGSDFNFAVSLPPSPTGGHYHAHLEAHTTTPHAVTCLGDADFTVVAGQTASASITLVCDDDLVNGDQKFNVTVDSHVCPLYVDFASTSPTTVQANGGVATLSGTAHDETQTPQTSGFTYAWSAPSGSGTLAQAAPSSANATFTCGAPNNNVVLTLTATRLDQGCSDSISVFVNCASANCGNGKLDAGETCDDGNTIDNDSCPADCTFVCGDGKIEGNEQCDPPNSTTCGTLNGLACQLLPYCGDGIKNGTEQCDDGNKTQGDSCENDCTTPKCGNGIKDSGEACDDGNTVAGDGCENDCTKTPGPAVCGDSVVGGTEQCDPAVLGKCFTTCQLETSPACSTCEAAVPACASQMNACDVLTGTVGTLTGTAATHGANLYAGQANKDVCNTVLECVRKTNCANNSYTDCICGIGADATACINGDLADPNTGDLTGPCIDQIAGALQIRKDRYTTLFGGLADTTKPGGSAMSRVICDRTNCAGGAGLGQASNQVCFVAPNPAVP